MGYSLLTFSLGVQKPPPPSTWLPSSFGRFTTYEVRLRGHLSFATGILHAMFNLYRFRITHAAVQEMSSDLVECTTLCHILKVESGFHGSNSRLYLFQCWPVHVYQAQMFYASQ